MHNLRINISVKPKIMINSQEVCFNITRQCAQVGHKNINFFIYKNHLASVCRNGKQFIEQYSLHNFAQFLAHTTRNYLIRDVTILSRIK
jgi:hypothetical protein